MRKLFSLLLLGSFALTSVNAYALEKKLDVPHYPQENGCWCGVAVAEMVEQYYRGSSWKNYAQRQTNLSKSTNNGGIKVGNTIQSNGSDSPCGPTGGVNTTEMLTMLNHRLDEHGKRFKDGVWSVTGDPKRSTYFHSRVIQSINNGDPFIFAGHTRYANGEKKYLQHWYIITGFKDADAKGNTITSEDGYYIHDAAVNGGFSHLKTLGVPGKFVSHDNMVKYIAESRGKLYPMVQVN